MKLLFINPSLRPGSQHLFLPVGLGYVMTYIKKAGFKFDLLIITHCLSDKIAFIKNISKPNKNIIIRKRKEPWWKR